MLSVALLIMKLTPYEEPEGSQDPGSTTTATGSYPAPDNPSLDPDILLQ
jgi:hypothetical protein